MSINKHAEISNQETGLLINANSLQHAQEEEDGHDDGGGTSSFVASSRISRLY